MNERNEERIFPWTAKDARLVHNVLQDDPDGVMSFYIVFFNLFIPTLDESVIERVWSSNDSDQPVKGLLKHYFREALKLFDDEIEEDEEGDEDNG